MQMKTGRNVILMFFLGVIPSSCFYGNLEHLHHIYDKHNLVEKTSENLVAFTWNSSLKDTFPLSALNFRLC